MEDILKQILSKLDTLEIGQGQLANGQKALENRQVALEKGQRGLITGQVELVNRQEALENGQRGLITGLDLIALEQSEMRKEVAFYYGSMMKKFDEGKKELSSEIKQITAVQKEHQNVLEYLNEKQ